MRYNMLGLCLDDCKHYIVDQLKLTDAKDPVLDEKAINHRRFPKSERLVLYKPELPTELSRDRWMISAQPYYCEFLFSIAAI